MTYWINSINYKQQVEAEPLIISEINRELIVYQIQENKRNLYVVTDVKTGARVLKAKDKQEALEEVLKMKDAINNFNPEVEAFLIKELNHFVDKECFEKYILDFETLFGHSIYEFLNLLILKVGCNGRMKISILELENLYINNSDYFDISLKEYIRKKHGDYAVEIVEYFL